VLQEKHSTASDLRFYGKTAGQRVGRSHDRQGIKKVKEMQRLQNRRSALDQLLKDLDFSLRTLSDLRKRQKSLGKLILCQIAGDFVTD
jgi:hypothetical protein